MWKKNFVGNTETNEKRETSQPTINRPNERQRFPTVSKCTERNSFSEQVNFETVGLFDVESFTETVGGRCSAEEFDVVVLLGPFWLEQFDQSEQRRTVDVVRRKFNVRFSLDIRREHPAETKTRPLDFLFRLGRSASVHRLLVSNTSLVSLRFDSTRRQGTICWLSSITSSIRVCPVRCRKNSKQLDNSAFSLAFSQSAGCRISFYSSLSPGAKTVSHRQYSPRRSGLATSTRRSTRWSIRCAMYISDRLSRKWFSVNILRTKRRTSLIWGNFVRFTRSIESRHLALSLFRSTESQ